MTTIVVNIKDNEIINKAVIKTAFSILDDGKYRVQIEAINERSLPQNKYYWKVIVPEVQQGLKAMGWDEIKHNEDAHEFIKKEFLQRTITNHISNEKKVIPGSTANLTTKEFNELIDAIIKWGVEFLGIQIPFPNEVMIAHFDSEVNATIIQS